MLRIGNVAAGVENTAVSGAELVVVAMRIGQALDTRIVGFVAKTVRACACTTGRTRSARAVARASTGLTGVVPTAAHAALGRRKTRLPRDQSTAAGSADDVGRVVAVVRGRIAGLDAVAVLPIVAIAVILTLHAKTGKRLAAKCTRRAVDRSPRLTEAVTACLLTVAEQTVVAVLI